MMMRLSILAVKPTSGTELIESVASWLGPTSPLLRATILYSGIFGIPHTTVLLLILPRIRLHFCATRYEEWTKMME